MSRLALRSLTKRFGRVTAVAPLTLDLPAGSIHALLGENGAGKSTLVRMVAGVTVPDAGRVLIDGRDVRPGDPRAARAAGVGIVHQHFALIDALSVAENLLLGRTEDRRRVTRPAALAREATTLAAAHGLDIGDPYAACGTLPVGTRARIEILRALAAAPHVLLLDEPTAVLTPPEVTELFATLRRLRHGGTLIVLVTHKLDEALALCDAVTVLRGGRVVAAGAAADVSAARLAAIMVGSGEGKAAPAGAGAAPLPLRTHARNTARDPPENASREAPQEALQDTPRDAAAPAHLTARGLRTPPRAGFTTLHDVDLHLVAGTIHGIAGVDGNGQRELAEALAGVGPRAGSVTVGGVTLAPGDVRAAQRAGVLLIPSDRQRDGLALDLTVAENVLLAAPLLDRFAPRGVVDDPGARTFTADLLREYRIATAGTDQPVRDLSGGNQQRIVIARTLAQHPRVLIAVNPTRGLDIAATDHVHTMLRRTAVDGGAVLLVSTDLDEILTLATTVQVLLRGRLAPPVRRLERETLGRLMAGLAP